MTVRRAQRSNRTRLTAPPTLAPRSRLTYHFGVTAGTSAEPGHPRSPGRRYPESWERVAELRVFRTTTARWQQLIGWRGEMRRKGWKLLHVSSEKGEMFAVFGRTRPELLSVEAAEDE